MITDRPPRAAARRAEYQRSDALHALELPPVPSLRPHVDAVEAGLADENRIEVKRACVVLADEVARAQGLPAPTVAVLGTRPHKTEGGVYVYEKFGDYHLETARIRVWMRTAMRRQVTSLGTLLHTLCHELVHHLDVVGLGISDRPHTRGFYERAALLYHHARGTPRKPLVWVGLSGGQYRIDWQRTLRR